MKIVPDMVGVTVKNLKTSVAFYRLLGLDFPEPGDEDYIEVTKTLSPFLAHCSGLKDLSPPSRRLLLALPLNLPLRFVCGSTSSGLSLP